MSEFNLRNWKEALASLYERCVHDADYRSRCLADPVAAMKEVSDIDLPEGLKFQFLDSRADLVYSYILPPTQPAETTRDSEVTALIRWSTVCTEPTCDDLVR